MRLVPIFCGLAALAFAQGAAAVTVSPISFSPEFETELSEDLGEREGVYLREDVETAVARALSARGVSAGSGGDTIEITIIDAQPNRPTLGQLSARPGLDYIRSVSVGGAELRAVVRNASGDVIAEVEHRRYNHSLDEFHGIPPAGTWSEARRAIRRFAEKVADAYVAQSGQ
jgi:hypothetical protein